MRVVTPTEVPGGKPPATLDDCITWASWLAFQTVTGGLDGTTVREANRSLVTLKDSLHKAELLKRIKELERQLKAYQQRSAAR